jgi:glycosyltransferase involved in cell wall biosynthesis
MQSITIVEVGVSLNVRRGDVVVCVPVFGAQELFLRCLDSILSHTSREIPILIADDCSPERELPTLSLEIVRNHDRAAPVYYFRQPTNVGFVENMNCCFAMSAPADVVIVNSDCEVAAGWLEGLRSAAYCDTIIATATPLTNHGTLVSVPERNKPQPGLPEGLTLEEVAAAIGRTSQRLRPHIPTLIGHCAYIKRAALELVGGFDAVFSPGYGEEVDFAQRCLLRGMGHVVADEVFVLHHGSASFGISPERARLQHEHELLIAERYPYYHDWIRVVAETETGPLAQVIATARRAIRGLSVTIDGSCLGGAVTGTQVHVLEVIQAVHRVGGVKLRVAVPSNLSAEAARVLQQLDGVELVRIDGIGAKNDPARRSDVVHRPYQIGLPEELTRLRSLGSRLVITQQDFIAYRNPGYFGGFEEWERYRQVTRAGLAEAERVVFISEHAAREAIREGLVEPRHLRIVPIGVDHYYLRMVGGARRPESMDKVAESGFILCLGTDFLHKNRLFALQVLQELQERHHWDGYLVIAGPRVAWGSSAEMDGMYLAEHPKVAAKTAILGAVSEEEKRWLLENARLVICPTTYEGFGLVPFEAAEAGVPCLFPPQAALEEVLPKEAALIEPWDAVRTAERAMVLMEDRVKARAQIQLIRETACKYRWDDVGRRLIDVYMEAAETLSRLERDGGLRVRTDSAVGVEEALLLSLVIKAVGFWQAYGLLRGTWLGVRGLIRRVYRRLRKRRKDHVSSTSGRTVY